MSAKTEVVVGLRSGWFSGLCAGLAVSLGVVILAGWMAGVETPFWRAARLDSVKPNTALGFVLAGLALGLVRRGPAWGGRKMIARVAAAAVAFIGGAALWEHLWGFGPTGGTAGWLVSAAERMSVSSAVGLTALGVALAGLDLTVRDGRRPTHLLALLAAYVGWLGVLGHVYKMESFYTLWASGGLSLYSAVVLTAMGFGVLCARRGPGALQMLTNPGPGGVVARGLLPIVLLVPVVLGRGLAWAEQAGWTGERAGVAVHAALTVLLLGFFVWLTAIWADGAESRRAALAEELQRAKDELEERVRLRTAELRRANAALEEREELLARAQRVAKLGSWSLDTDSGCVRWTDELFRIVGLPVEGGAPDYGRQAGMFTEESWVRLQAAVARSIDTGEGYELELEVRRPDGAECWAVARAAAERDESGRVVRLTGTFQDITEARRAREELGRQRRELERSNRDLEQFAYVASHDLQEPLRAVSGCVQLLSRRHGAKLDADANELIAHAVDGARRMQNLILDLLTYSRVGTGVMRRADVDLGVSVADALSNLRIALEEAKAEVTRDTELPLVRADRALLTMLLQNLIGNAVKYAARGRTPRIHIGAKRDEANGWTLSVRDNGEGIDERHFDRIFVIFQRLHTREEAEGTGIGLALCKKIVERHGGRIWVESTPGVGSCFFFNLPQGAPL